MISHDTWIPLARQLESAGHTLVPISDNLVDHVWDNRPAPPQNPVDPLDIRYTGKSWRDKVCEIRDEIRNKGAVALVVSALDEIAWLFNLRGSDIDYNPVFFAYSVITLDDI